MIDIRQDPKVTKKPAAKGRRRRAKKPAKEKHNATNDEIGAAAATTAAAPPVAPPPRQTVEAWIKQRRLSPPLTAALWRHTKWGRGRLVTGAEFNEALAMLHGTSASEV